MQVSKGVTALFPLVQNGDLKPVLNILTDYPRDDLASDEVRQALVTACAERGVHPFSLDVAAVPGLDTVVAGFKTAQLALNSRLGFGHVIHANCAPRRNIISQHSKGEGVVAGILPNGVALLVVNAGFSLSHFVPFMRAGLVRFFRTSIPDAGSQFRSRDYFPDAMAQLAAFLAHKADDKTAGVLKAGKGHEILQGFPLLGDEVKADEINELSEGAICYIDNFGNIKLNLNHDRIVAQHGEGTQMVVSIGATVMNAVVGKAGFSQGEGELALTRGSSGWKTPDGKDMRFTEIFLRGGSAAASFSKIHTGDQVLGVSFNDMKKIFAALKESGLKKIGNLDLYLMSEAQILQLLAARGLVRDGFDTAPLQKALAGNSLLKALV